MSDRQVECYNRVASCRVGNDDGRGVCAFGVGYPVNPGEAVTCVVEFGVVG